MNKFFDLRAAQEVLAELRLADNAVNKNIIDFKMKNL